MPKVSVITPASRGVKILAQLLRDFRNQTFRDFEHIIVFDGKPPADVIQLMKDQGGKNTVFTSVPKDLGDMHRAPGTKTRNHGTAMASGEYVVYFDDDDRCRDDYLESLVTACENYGGMAITQMMCSEKRVFRQPEENQFRLIPEVGMGFPVMCHCGTPVAMLRREWALAEPWKDESEHDFWFFKRIVDKFKPTVAMVAGWRIDVDGYLGNVKDWVTIPPMVRN